VRGAKPLLAANQLAVRLALRARRPRACLVMRAACGDKSAPILKLVE
jgi:hypothetical protein